MDKELKLAADAYEEALENDYAQSGKYEGMRPDEIANAIISMIKATPEPLKATGEDVERVLIKSLEKHGRYSGGDEEIAVITFDYGAIAQDILAVIRPADSALVEAFEFYANPTNYLSNADDFIEPAEGLTGCSVQMVIIDEAGKDGGKLARQALASHTKEGM